MFGFSGSNNGFGNKPAGSTGFSFGQNNNNTNTQPSASGFGFGAASQILGRLLPEGLVQIRPQILLEVTNKVVQVEAFSVISLLLAA